MIANSPPAGGSLDREQLLAKTFVELTDTLVDEFDVLDVLHTLSDRTVELLRADTAGISLLQERSVRQSELVNE